jgi:hypothetical protein
VSHGTLKVMSSIPWASDLCPWAHYNHPWDI